jgi:hypothetical protein
MKTRLDEIIHTEMQKMARGDEAYECFSRAVVSSFRHGVEQTMASFLPESGYGNKVQPAPAEEKCHSCRHVPHGGSPCSSGECDNWRGCMDRRHGERRRGEERCFITSGCERRWFLNGWHELANCPVNRRHGQDRRHV